MWALLDDLIALVALAKQGQELKSDLTGYLQGMAALRRENARFALLARLSRDLTRILLGRWF